MKDVKKDKRMTIPISGSKKKKNISLSKSSFLKGLQCHKYLYLYKYHRGLQDEISEQQQAIFQGGTDAGILAQKIFPGGVEIPYDGLTISEQLNLTQSKLDEGVTTIYEASFKHNDVFVKVDILHKGANGWELYEVKSSTGVKETHFDDVGIQFFVLNGAGIAVSKAAVVYINNKYVRDGEIDVHQLFAIKDVTEAVIANQDNIGKQLLDLQKMLVGDEPNMDIGEYCNYPYDCNFIGHCWSHIPGDSVFSLRGRGVNKYDLYRSGVVELKDVQKDSLNDAQRIQYEGTVENQDRIDKTKIKEFLDSLWYPLYFLDFETFMSAIPPFDGTRPYQQIPFQYSLHYMEKDDGELKHHEYLADGNIDPRAEIAKRLIDEIPENACVLTYNQSFEIGVLGSLKAWLPIHDRRIETIIVNIRDLMRPFRKKDVYLRQMKGSYSIKAVLPALVPDFSYDGLEINNGGMAMNAYEQLRQMDDSSEKEQIRNALIEYCGLDTLAMVKIVEKLSKYCEK